jgi:AraC family transcriptional regulator of adaptative response/methylated-DNA-[protein]-cysteine methyltransferase
MITTMLPNSEQMYDALVRRDPAFDGIFFTGVRTTGIFCRPICPAKKPARENVEFFADARSALFAGYRPCKRCEPLATTGEVPAWLEPLISGHRSAEQPPLDGRGAAQRRARSNARGAGSSNTWE